MEYLKLIALQIDDFSSSIFFEDNYKKSDIDEAEKTKRELEQQRYHCILANVKSNMEV